MYFLSIYDTVMKGPIVRHLERSVAVEGGIPPVEGQMSKVTCQGQR